MQKIEETQAKQIDMGFLVGDTGVKNTFFCFMKMELTDMAEQGWIENFIHTFLKAWKQSDVPVSNLVVEACRHLLQTSRAITIANSNEAKTNLIKEGSTVKAKADDGTSSMAFEDDSTLRYENAHHKLVNLQVVRKTHQRKV